ncbi:site-2 protease family protein [Marinicauda algicola]|uniref:Zinc metalloprotease n=1 Tax=Marinicauda algicola TaxID=2029849 RepID=A0A4S2H2A7_9PROT|nr:site-2 protease family protein [Marinicauda algicola]TGY89302.1 site-2 protease family protein [Marinicauda algicola]
MPPMTLTLGRVFGIAIRVNIGWALIALLIAWSLATGAFPTLYEGLPEQLYWWMAIAGVIGLAVSILLHELSHSLVGRLFGIEVETITLFMFGGAAQMTEEPTEPKAEMIMAAAGPAMSLVLAAAFEFASRATAGMSEPMSAVLGYLALLNLVLAIFNLIPAFPMDGGRVLRGAIWQVTGNLRKATGIASRAGSIFGWILSGLGLLLILAGAFVGGLWWILIGQFIRMAALGAFQQSEMKRIFEGRTLDELMTREVETVDAAITLEDFIRDHLFTSHHRLYPVMRDGRLAGTIGIDEIREKSQDTRRQLTVGEAMTPLAESPTLRAGCDAMEALQMMQKSERSRFLVVQDGALKGLITLKDLLDHLQVRSELAGD